MELKSFKFLQCASRTVDPQCPPDVVQVADHGATEAVVSWPRATPRYRLASSASCSGGGWTCTSFARPSRSSIRSSPRHILRPHRPHRGRTAGFRRQLSLLLLAGLRDALPPWEDNSAVHVCGQRFQQQHLPLSGERDTAARPRWDRHDHSCPDKLEYLHDDDDTAQSRG